MIFNLIQMFLRHQENITYSRHDCSKQGQFNLALAAVSILVLKKSSLIISTEDRKNSLGWSSVEKVEYHRSVSCENETNKMNLILFGPPFLFGAILQSVNIFGLLARRSVTERFSVIASNFIPFVLFSWFYVFVFIQNSPLHMLTPKILKNWVNWLPGIWHPQCNGSPIVRDFKLPCLHVFLKAN